MRAVKAAALLTVLAAMIAVPALEGSGGNRMEFGIAVPILTSLGFSSFSVGLEAYVRLLGATFAWETALKTYTSFDVLYIRNTVATAAALHLCLGHVTNLLPYFGLTYLTVGLGLTLGRALVARFVASLAASIGGGKFTPFLELRFQLGIDP
jgi:hypothetical protein